MIVRTKEDLKGTKGEKGTKDCINSNVYARSPIILSLLLITVSLSCSTFAQQTTQISVENNVAVSGPGASFVEPYYIAVNPRSPRSLIISATAIRPDQPTKPTAFISEDVGETWKESPLPMLDKLTDEHVLRRGVDTWLSFSPDGRLYLSALALLWKDSWGTAPIFVFRSDDSGKTWSAPTIMRSNTFDHPIIVTGERGLVILVTSLDLSDTPGQQLTGAKHFIGVFRSTDGGQHFSPTAFIAPSNLFFESNPPLILTDNSVVVTFREMALFGRDGKMRTPINSTRLWAARSKAGGRAFQIPHVVGDARLEIRQNVWQTGATPQLAVDRSPISPYYGRVYEAWNAIQSGRMNVAVAYSSNYGDDWSAPTIVDGGPGESFFASIAVSKSGMVGDSLDAGQ